MAGTQDDLKIGFIYPFRKNFRRFVVNLEIVKVRQERLKHRALLERYPVEAGLRIF